MPFFRPINLPPPLIAQSTALTGLGLYLTFFRRPPFTSGSYSAVVPANPSPRTADAISVLGLALTALQVNYLVASYMPFEENQFVTSSVPVRIGLAVGIGVLCAWRRKEMSRDGLWELMGLAILDGAAAVQLGFQLGRFDGIVTTGGDKLL